MPLMCAYFKKYKDEAKGDLFEITDRTREWFDIDTSQYMNYTFDDLDHHHHHINHGPQPDGEVLDSTWFTELDKYLKGEPNKWKEHPMYRDYKFEYNDGYDWPTVESVHDTFHAAEIEQHTPESLLKKEIKDEE
jgi:hypothetical protein